MERSSENKNDSTSHEDEVRQDTIRQRVRMKGRKIVRESEREGEKRIIV